jgi:hypothetical protein
MNRTYCSESACIYENEAITDFTFIIEAIEACTTNRTITLLLPCRVDTWRVISQARFGVWTI